MTVFLHCADCVKERPKNANPKDYARLQVSIDGYGITIACLRHKKIIVRLDPVGLLNMMSHESECDMCKRGIPHEH